MVYAGTHQSSPPTTTGTPTLRAVEPVRGQRAAAPTARVALVHLGNERGLGTTRRVAVWRELLEAACCEPVEVNLLAQHRRPVPSPLVALPALRGAVVPETATWSARSARAAIRAMDPDAVVFVTPRAFHPALASEGRVRILDIQDRFSRSYRGRAAVERRFAATASWQALAWVTDRFERRDHQVTVVAAGWSEAREIGATWIPNTVPTTSSGPITDHADAQADLLFFGKLSALPNIDALRRLAALWPALTAEIPTLRVLVAGADLCPEVRALAAERGWSAEEGFTDVAALCRRARVAVAPLRHANGIQNKVLEAAACGLPQVVSPQALAGTAPGFPAIATASAAGLVSGISSLLSDGSARLDLARRAHAHVVERYSVERWSEVVHDLLAA